MIRVVIADDHTLVREGIRALLEKAGDIEVVGQAEDGATAVALVRELTPDVLVTDVSMPIVNGIQAAEQVRAEGLPTEVVILSMHGEPSLIRHALRSGARGYVLKDSVTEDLLTAIRAAARGAIYLSPAISSTVLATEAAPPATQVATDGGEQLTPRELEVLTLIGAGHTNRAIALKLGISVKTVERHRTQLMAKLDVHNLVDLVRIAIQRGLIQLDD
jgi:DNA-binding NarL/FixJ family response regulator